MERKLTFIDLFAGCGGLSEGFLSSGKFEGLAHVEWEIPMVNTLRNRLVEKWGHSSEDALKRVVHFDIQNVQELIFGGWSLESMQLYASSNHVDIINEGLKGLIGEEEVDLIIGGPPCQAYSIHGRATDPNSMQDDYRNYLFESFAKTVDFFQPNVFVFENVPGILTAKPGGVPVTKRIHKAFKEIGYSILNSEELSKTTFDCSDFGVPQVRKRVLIFGVKNNSTVDLKNLYKSLSLKKSDKKVSVKDAIGSLPKIYPLDEPIKIGGKNYSHKADCTKDIHHVPRYHNSRDVEIFKEWVGKNMNNIPHEEKVQFYFKKTGKKTLYSKYRNIEWDKQSYTIVAHLHKDGLMFIHPDKEQARSITIREAALLMTFPKDYNFKGSNASCYKMIGNAVPVKFAKTIAESIGDLLITEKQIENECIDSM